MTSLSNVRYACIIPSHIKISKLLITCFSNNFQDKIKIIPLTIKIFYAIYIEELIFMRLWYSGITSAFQADDTGSTPVRRS